jgi:hypothetical protein
MTHYAPIFCKIVESSLWKEPPAVRVLFITLLVRKDADHIARVPDHHLPGIAHLTDDEVIEGLRILSEPDKRSKIPQPFDGRRIERHAEGWLILNGDKYQKEMVLLNERARWARAQARARAKRRKLAPPGNPHDEQFDGGPASE